MIISRFNELPASLSSQPHYTDHFNLYGVGTIKSTGELSFYWLQNVICKLLSIINTVTFYRTHTENHKYALTLAFSIYEINRNPDILPNMSLTFKFSNYNCHWKSKYNSFIHLSLQNHDILPNYMCKEFTKCAMALTRLNWATTVKLNTILNNFMSQQVSVCVCVCVCVYWDRVGILTWNHIFVGASLTLLGLGKSK